MIRRSLITFGLILLGLGLIWPWIRKTGLGRLPGDFVYERGPFRIYFPLATSLVLSLLLTLILWITRR